MDTTASPLPSWTSHDQPEPNRLTPAVFISSWKLENDPNAESIAPARSPAGSPPPSGLIHSQKSEWL